MITPGENAEDVVTLRFVGENEDGSTLHELKAAHVADVLEGLVELASDFAKAGAFGDGPPPEVYVRPAQEGSFILEVVFEVVNFGFEHKEAVVASVPTVATAIWWATRSIRAEVSDFDYLENGNVKVSWQDNTVDEIPLAAWEELNKRKTKRKAQLRKIMAPLSDDRVTAMQVSEEGVPDDAPVEGETPRQFTLERLDYQLARPEDEVEETSTIFEAEARMAAVDFESGEKWRVKTSTATRQATVEDSGFLLKVDRGLALHKNDVFNLRIREDSVTKNGRTRSTWTVLEVKGHRRGAEDDDGS